MNKKFKKNLNEMQSLMDRMERKVHSSLYNPTYNTINEAKSAFGAFPASRVGDIIPTKEKCLMNEGIQWEVGENEKGGVIVFSTDVNAIELSKNKIANWIQQKIATLKNRMNATSKIDQIANDNELVGWTIGHYFDGRYKAKNGQNYGENSLSLELVGIDVDKLIKIAEEICKEFQQESVLVKSFEDGRIMFVDPN